jgi:hypothetical protein
MSSQLVSRPHLRQCRGSLGQRSATGLQHCRNQLAFGHIPMSLKARGASPLLISPRSSLVAARS